MDDWLDLRWMHDVNAPGSITLVLHKDDPRVSLFADDYLIEVRRSDPVTGLAWYKEAEGLIRKRQPSVAESGDKTFPVRAHGLLSLCGRRIIGYYAGSTGAAKSGVAETVIKDYIRENLGADATLGNGRLAAGVLANFTIEVDGAGGAAWTGSREFKRLLSVIQEIALQTGTFIDIINTAIPPAPIAFEFRFYEDYRGIDRTTVGLDAATGLNGAGNVPIQLSLEMGSLAAASLAFDREKEINACLVLGAGKDANQLWQWPEDAAAIAISPWNRVEDVINASNESDLTALGDAGEAKLQDAAAIEQLDIDPIQLTNLQYGNHYTWGDGLTTVFDGVAYDKMIIGASGQVPAGQEERLALKFRDRPRRL
jgi:hypothetical protein